MWILFMSDSCKNEPAYKGCDYVLMRWSESLFNRLWGESMWLLSTDTMYAISLIAQKIGNRLHCDGSKLKQKLTGLL